VTFNIVLSKKKYLQDIFGLQSLEQTSLSILVAGNKGKPVCIALYFRQITPARKFSQKICITPGKAHHITHPQIAVYEKRNTVVDFVSVET
jgi:hypothetical protein